MTNATSAPAANAAQQSIPRPGHRKFGDGHKFVMAMGLVILVVDALSLAPWADRDRIEWLIAANVVGVVSTVVAYSVTRGSMWMDERIAGLLSTIGMIAPGLAMVYPHAQPEAIIFGTGLWLGGRLVQPFGWMLLGLAIALGPALVVDFHAYAVRSVVIFVLAMGITLAAFTLNIRFRRIMKQRAAARLHQDSTLLAADVGILALNDAGKVRLTNPALFSLLRPGVADAEIARAGDEGPLFAGRERVAVPADELPSARVMRGEEFDGEIYWLSDSPDAAAVAVSGTVSPALEGERNWGVVAFQDVTELVRALNVRDDFVAQVSHELRTPLTAILGFVEFALEGEDLRPATADQLRRVFNNATRLNNLVNDLLRGATTTTTLRPRRINLAEIAESAVASTKVRAQRAGVAVVAETEPMAVDADPARLDRVVDTLLSLMLKVSGGEPIVVSTRTDGALAVLEVSRPGAVVTLGEGQLADQIDVVRAHGGLLDVATTAQGTVFTISLPLQAGVAPKAALVRAG